MDNLPPTSPEAEQRDSRAAVTSLAAQLETLSSPSHQTTSSSPSQIASLTLEHALLQLHHNRLTSTSYAQLPDSKDVANFWYSQMKSSLTWEARFSLVATDLAVLPSGPKLRDTNSHKKHYCISVKEVNIECLCTNSLQT
jgi:hypothetical protein